MRNRRRKIKNKNELSSQKKKKTPMVNRKQKNHKVKNAQKVIHDGVQFQSNLEKTMYQLLVDNNYVFKKDFFYEEAVITLVESFIITNDIWTNKKSTKKFSLDSKSIRKMVYTPDFTDNVDPSKCKWIIETKGLMNRNDAFPLRFKLFKMWLLKNNPTCTVYVPSNKAQCEETVKLILSGENSN